MQQTSREEITQAQQDAAKVQAKLVAQLYESLPGILVNLILMPLVLLAVFWSRASHAFLVGWTIAALIVLAVRWALALAYARSSPPPEQTRRWAWYFTATSLVSGLLWGVAAWALFEPTQLGAVIFLYVCVIGLAAGSIIVTSFWLPAYYAYAVPSLGLSIVPLLRQDEPIYWGLAGLLGMFIVIISRVAKRQNRAARELFALQFENERLMQQVAQERDSALRMNEILDQRVHERTQELEREVLIRRQAEAELYRIAHHDALTGLPNRRAFTQFLDTHLRQAQPTPLALLFIDLDRFKQINDVLGHQTGDAVLRAAASRLQSLGEGTLFRARIGGDEFVIVLDATRGRDEVGRYAQMVIERLASGYEIEGSKLFVSASIGVGLSPTDDSTPETLVRNADTAMYDAKAQGRNRYRFYHPQMTAVAAGRTRMEQLLRHAIDRQEVFVVYQIKVDITGKPSGLEALLRWQSAELGLVPPAEFIPLAEETGQILTLGEWVLRQCCEQLIAWRAAGLQVPRLAVNLSARQVEDGDIVAVVQRMLQQTGVPAQALELEITESIILNATGALDVLRSLAGLGVTLSIDDFGTGYSSLAYLRDLPIHSLKIDRSFVAGMQQLGREQAIVKAIAALAHSLHLRIVAEGVENVQQARMLAGVGVHELQGYFYARPQRAAEIPALWQRLAAICSVS